VAKGRRGNPTGVRSVDLREWFAPRACIASAATGVGFSFTSGTWAALGLLNNASDGKLLCVTSVAVDLFPAGGAYSALAFVGGALSTASSDSNLFLPPARSMLVGSATPAGLTTYYELTGALDPAALVGTIAGSFTGHHAPLRLETPLCLPPGSGLYVTNGQALRAPSGVDDSPMTVTWQYLMLSLKEVFGP
jgi:hypothetical protein